jgi:hypothetical protein
VKARIRALCADLVAAEIEGLCRIGRLSPFVAVRYSPTVFILAVALVAAWTILVSAY